MSTRTFMDPRDGEVYKTVELLDGREWFVENLRFACEGSMEPDPTALRRQRHSPYTAYDLLRTDACITGRPRRSPVHQVGMSRRSTSGGRC